MSDIENSRRQVEVQLIDPANDQVEIMPDDMRAHLTEWLKRYPEDQRRSGVFEALRLAQEVNGGWLTTAWMNAVADFLGMARTSVYEVATFYSMYKLAPVGRHVIELCTNISCMLNGANDTLAALKNRLKINVNETTEDGLFTLTEVECLGACVKAPACQVGKRYYESLTADKVDAFLNEVIQHGK